MAKQSETTGGSFVVMVPKASITGKADHIKRITLIMVVLASVTAVLLGFIINITQEDSEIELCNELMEALSSKIKQVNTAIRQSAEKR